jgi:hypothetical protein
VAGLIEKVEPSVLIFSLFPILTSPEDSTLICAWLEKENKINVSNAKVLTSGLFVCLFVCLLNFFHDF